LELMMKYCLYLGTKSRFFPKTSTKTPNAAEPKRNAPRSGGRLVNDDAVRLMHLGLGNQYFEDTILQASCYCLLVNAGWELKRA